MLRFVYSFLAWLLDLFNSPPRASMTSLQKIGRSLFLTGDLVMLSVLSAMACTVGVFFVEKACHVIDSIPDLLNATIILSVSIIVNGVCVYILFQVRKIDRHLMLGPGEKPTSP